MGAAVTALWLSPAFVQNMGYGLSRAPSVQPMPA